VYTEQVLKQVCPRLASPLAWVTPLNAAAQRFEITTPERLAAFLAQIAHESAELTRLEENLSYSATRIMAVWPGRFPTLGSAQPFERAPEALANRVYASRLGNGDGASGDGWRFRGRGLLQITGRGNYRTAAQALLLPLEGEPERLATPDVATLSAAHFWHSRGLNELADDRSGDDDDADFVRISVIINGGPNGLHERRRYWALAKAALK
jgi:putative chitinase